MLSSCFVAPEFDDDDDDKDDEYDDDGDDDDHEDDDNDEPDPASAAGERDGVVEEQGLGSDRPGFASTHRL